MEKIHYYNKEINLEKIASHPEFIRSEEPLYIVDLADIVNKFSVWKKVMPRVQPFYAVKCNDHPVILKLLSELGTGFDCASKGEISRVIDLNVNPNRIIFANPTKPVAHLLHAKQYGVYTMTYDGEFELHKIKKYFPNASLVLRIRCEAEKAQCPLGEKFGCDPEIDAPYLLKKAKELNLNVVGISFHVGSGCQDFPVYERAIAHAQNLFQYGKTLGFDMNLLDIGGGFPGEKNSKILEVGSIVTRALDKYFPGDDVNLIAEPGRFFVASSHTLICKVHSKREVIRENKLEKVMYFINDGVYGSFNCILYDHQAATPHYLRRKFLDEEPRNSEAYKSSIWGPTCDALDQICEEVYLPKIEIGGVIVFENMGAYTVPIASPFNGFPLPKMKFYMDKKYKVKSGETSDSTTTENNACNEIKSDFKSNGISEYNLEEINDSECAHSLKLIRKIKHHKQELYHADYIDDLDVQSVNIPHVLAHHFGNDAPPLAYKSNGLDSSKHLEANGSNEFTINGF